MLSIIIIIIASAVCGVLALEHANGTDARNGSEGRRNLLSWTGETREVREREVGETRKENDDNFLDAHVPEKKFLRSLHVEVPEIKLINPLVDGDECYIKCIGKRGNPKVFDQCNKNCDSKDVSDVESKTFDSELREGANRWDMALKLTRNIASAVVIVVKTLLVDKDIEVIGKERTEHCWAVYQCRLRYKDCQSLMEDLKKQLQDGDLDHSKMKQEFFDSLNSKYEEGMKTKTGPWGIGIGSWVADDELLNYKNRIMVLQMLKQRVFRTLFDTGFGLWESFNKLQDELQVKDEDEDEGDEDDTGLLKLLSITSKKVWVQIGDCIDSLEKGSFSLVPLDMSFMRMANEKDGWASCTKASTNLVSTLFPEDKTKKINRYLEHFSQVFADLSRLGFHTEDQDTLFTEIAGLDKYHQNQFLAKSVSSLLVDVIEDLYFLKNGGEEKDWSPFADPAMQFSLAIVTNIFKCGIIGRFKSDAKDHICKLAIIMPVDLIAYLFPIIKVWTAPA